MSSRQTADDRPNEGELNSALRGNIEALRERRKQEKRYASSEEKLADAITTFTGSMRFVYLHLVMYGVWIAWNFIPGIPHFDPTFVILAMAASVEAIFLSTFVLISQNRAQAAADKRDDLDLHINLLAEHELTRLIQMVSAIAQKLEVRTGTEHEVAEITKDVAPEVVLKESSKIAKLECDEAWSCNIDADDRVSQDHLGLSVLPYSSVNDAQDGIAHAKRDYHAHNYLVAVKLRRRFHRSSRNPLGKGSTVPSTDSARYSIREVTSARPDRFSSKAWLSCAPTASPRPNESCVG